MGTFCVIAKPVRRLVVAIRSPSQCKALLAKGANLEQLDNWEFVVFIVPLRFYIGPVLQRKNFFFDFP